MAKIGPIKRLKTILFLKKRGGENVILCLWQVSLASLNYIKSISASPVENYFCSENETVYFKIFLEL